MTKERLKTYLNWIVYEIYPKSFADSNGDGMGDLKGIISKLEYLKSLSVDAIWICPCFPSPGDDNGYDISDYKDIAPEYGTLKDMDELIAKAHSLDIKVILDLVANHTSVAHAWFQQSKNVESPFSEFYYWSDKPLNDWKSIFTGKSVWIYSEERGQYYLASFAPTQADLNWTNPAVRSAMRGVVDFWVARGIDGFRCDVLDMISKDFSNPNGNGNGPKLHEYVRELFDGEDARNLFVVGECWNVGIDGIRLLCGLDRGELSCAFQFDHRFFGFDSTDSYKPAPYRLQDIAARLSKWQKDTQAADILYTLFWENHDSPRIVSRFGDEQKRYESATMLSTMLYLLRGVVFLYEGQELGLINTNFTEMDCFDDIEAKCYYENHKRTIDKGELFTRLNAFGRDNARRMMPWENKSTAAWIKTDERQLAYSVAEQESGDSILNYFRRLLAFRKKEKAFSEGTYRELALHENYFIYERAYQREKYIVVCNFKKPSTIDGLCGEVVFSNLSRKSPNGAYFPYECAVIKVNKYET